MHLFRYAGHEKGQTGVYGTVKCLKKNINRYLWRVIKKNKRQLVCVNSKK